MTNKTTRQRVVEIVAAAHAKGDLPDLRNMNLSGVDLSRLDLSDAIFAKSDLTRTNFGGSNLTRADFTEANLVRAYLSSANCCEANFYSADLGAVTASHANFDSAYMYRTDLRHSYLRYSNLSGVDIHEADLRYANLTGLLASGLPSGNLTFIPTPEGWGLTIGCWEGTTDELREMIAKDEGWPEAEGEQITERRPMLEGMVAACDAYAAAHPNAVAQAKSSADRWNGE